MNKLIQYIKQIRLEHRMLLFKFRYLTDKQIHKKIEEIKKREEYRFNAGYFSVD
jgi:hypothetical protein